MERGYRLSPQIPTLCIPPPTIIPHFHPIPPIFPRRAAEFWRWRRISCAAIPTSPSLITAPSISRWTTGSWLKISILQRSTIIHPSRISTVSVPAGCFPQPIAGAALPGDGDQPLLQRPSADVCRPASHRIGCAREATAAFALGAGAFCHWLFRQHQSGAEITHGSILSAWGGRTIGYRQAQLAVEAMRQWEPLLQATVPAPAKAAVHYVDLGKQMLQTEPAGDADYLHGVRSLYDRLVEENVPWMIKPKRRPWAVIRWWSPRPTRLPRRMLERVLEYVAGGRIWLAGPVTGYRTAEHTVPTDVAWGRRLEEAAGVVTRTCVRFGIGKQRWFFDSVSAPASALRFLADCGPVPGEYRLTGGGARRLLSLTEAVYGKGRILLLGTMPAGKKGRKLLRQLVRYACRLAGIAGSGSGQGRRGSGPHRPVGGMPASGHQYDWSATPGAAGRTDRSPFRPTMRGFWRKRRDADDEPNDAPRHADYSRQIVPLAGNGGSFFSP